MTANWQESRVLQDVRFFMISIIKLKINATKESATPFIFVPTVDIVGALSENLVQ